MRSPLFSRWLLAPGLRVYALGVAVHLLYAGLLAFAAPAAQWNWASGDTATYVAPARAFLQTGTFLGGAVPDYRRTIGYPLFLAGALKLAEATGLDWRLVVSLAQAFLFALAYPAVLFLGREVFGLGQAAAWACLAFTALSGAFVSYVPVVLSDALFATSLIAGAACGFSALRTGSLSWGLGHVGLISFAANVRPMLAFYPLAAASMHWAYLRAGGLTGDRARRLLLSGMFIATVLGVQIPSARNWLHHGVFTPTEIGSINLFNVLAREVLSMEKEPQRFEQGRAALDLEPSLGARIALRKHLAFGVFREYPLQTAALASFNLAANTFEPHWQNLWYRLRQTWYTGYDNVAWGAPAFLTALVFATIYVGLYAMALLQAFAVRRQPWIIAAALLFLAPYAFCATSYQGSRFRLWAEPLVILAAAVAVQRVFRDRRGVRPVVTPLTARTPRPREPRPAQS